MTQEDLEAIVGSARARAEAGEVDEAFEAASPLLERQPEDTRAAHALLALVAAQSFAVERGVEVVRAVFDAHAEDDELIGQAGSSLEGAHDLRFLNGPPPSDPVFARLAGRLRERAIATRGSAVEERLLRGLALAARLLGKAWDADAERAYRRLIELEPSRWEEQYDFGLFLKVRGRFAEGVAANRRAAELGGAEDDSVRWNLGICATGARDAATALAVWKEYGHRIEIGRFGLPDGRYAQVKVRLAQHPLAERSAEQNDPGLEETIWIERVSPCHGIVRSALYQDLGVDFGDVVLFDGAPITHHKCGDARVPVFPHLATLERCGYRILPFAGTQRAQGAIASLNEHLPDECTVYPHTETFAVMCAQCWASEEVDHAAHGEAEHHVVHGKVCAPPALEPAALRRALDEAALRVGVRLFVPELSRLVGDDARADVESRRMAMLER